MDLHTSGEQPIAELSRQVLGGAATLLLRRGFLLALSLAGMIVLARYLGPADFGVAAVASFVLAVGLTLSDIGTVPALLQQPADPDTRQMRALFGFELGRTLAMVAAVWLLAPLLAWLYDLNAVQARFVQAMAATALLGALCTIPAVLLERRLAYAAITRIDIGQALAQQLAQIGALLAGAGLWSFVLGALAGGLVRLGLTWQAVGRIELAEPYRWARPIWSSQVLAATLRRGGLVQLGGISHLLRDNLPALLAGPFYGVTGLGYLRWAQRTTSSVVQPITQALSRVSLAALARTQHDEAVTQRLAQLLTQTLLSLALPALALLATLMPALLQVVFTPRWTPALRAAVAYAAALAGGELCLLLVNICVALGMFGKALRVLTRWTLLQATLALALAPVLGYEGVALATALSMALPLWELSMIMRARLGLRLWALARVPLLAAALAGLTAWALRPVAASMGGLALAAAAGLLAAAATLLLGEPQLRRLVARPVL